MRQFRKIPGHNRTKKLREQADFQLCPKTPTRAMSYSGFHCSEARRNHFFDFESKVPIIGQNDYIFCNVMQNRMSFQMSVRSNMCVLTLLIYGPRWRALAYHGVYDEDYFGKSKLITPG